MVNKLRDAQLFDTLKYSIHNGFEKLLEVCFGLKNPDVRLSQY